ncbi:hypothetical protein HMPREF9554_00614 [Treponema phagedenis F0421]|nr:hypothetical protein HMPREF9554_00614 [Treponema phagedenis F0421]
MQIIKEYANIVTNTIPITFNERNVSRTIIGGEEVNRGQPLSAVVLNRGPKLNRGILFDRLANLNFSSIISIEESPSQSEHANFYDRFPYVKFIIPLEKVSIGEMINIGIAESNSDFAFVLWNDMNLFGSGPDAALIESVIQNDIICTTPMLLSEAGTPILNQIVPSLYKTKFSTEPMPCVKDNTPTMYAYDFAGIYNRKKTIQLGGFDYTILNPYWQNLDFGFRSYLWGEQIRINTRFKLKYEASPPPENISADISYRTFYLKNIAPIKNKESAYIKNRTFFPFLKNSGLHFMEALSFFREAKKWVEVNKYRYKKDAIELIKDWEPVL